MAGAGRGEGEGDGERPFTWCVIANVAREPHPEGSPPEMRAGTKHFAPGAKLYCAPPLWGDGCAKLRVLGRHRGGGPKLIEIVVATKWLTGWRARKVFHPHVVATLGDWWGDTEEAHLKAVEMAEALHRRGSDPPGVWDGGPGPVADRLDPGAGMGQDGGISPGSPG